MTHYIGSNQTFPQDNDTETFLNFNTKYQGTITTCMFNPFSCFLSCLNLSFVFVNYNLNLSVIFYLLYVKIWNQKESWKFTNDGDSSSCTILYYLKRKTITSSIICRKRKMCQSCYKTNGDDRLESCT